MSVVKTISKLLKFKRQGHVSIQFIAENTFPVDSVDFINLHNAPNISMPKRRRDAHQRRNQKIYFGEA